MFTIRLNSPVFSLFVISAVFSILRLSVSGQTASRKIL